MNIPYLLPAALVAAAGVQAVQAAKPKPVNIVLFYVDDMGYGDMAANGAIGYQTPNLDRLCAEGMRFTQFYSPAPVSSASRAGLMTGCYPNRIGIYGALQPRSATALNRDEWIIPQMLREQGYATCIVGKWHLGDARQFLPLQRGFDEYFGLPYSNDMWPYRYKIWRGKPGEVVNPASPPLPLYDGNEVVRTINTLEDEDELTTLYTERAVSFIERSARKPFFLYIPHNMPHTPLAVSEKFRGKSRQGAYGDVMMEIDWSVGEVMKALKQTGLDKNTLVIFTSDNGPWLNFGDHQGSAGALREGKFVCYEGGMRMPCVMRWPAAIPAGAVCNQLAGAIDLLPTFAAMTGGRLSDNPIDGVNILPLMRGQADAEPRTELIYCYSGAINAIRDWRFKLVVPHRHTSYEGVLPGDGGQPKPTVKVESDWELYDLRRDPGERYNVIAMYPEVVERLKARLAELSRELVDANTGSTGTGARPAGKIETR